MGELKSKKTASKWGRLFGVSATNIEHSNEEESVADSPTLVGEEHEGKRVETAQENRKSSPNASEPLSMADNCANGSAVPLVHPQPRPPVPVAVNEALRKHSNSGMRSPQSISPSVSARKMTPQGKSNPVSRSSSVKTKTFSSKDSKEHKEAAASPVSSGNQTLPRFKMLENGSHEHHLKAAKRQEKLTNMVKGLLGGKKLRDEAKSAVPNILQSSSNLSQKPPHPQNGGSSKPPTLFAGLVTQVKNNDITLSGGLSSLAPSEQQDSRSFVEKYGRCHGIIGKGSFGVVRLSYKKVGAGPNCEEVLYAVKEFKRKTNESDKQYNRRLTSEFCISSSLKHINIIDTLDLLKDAKGDYCEVMEYCAGGDLFTLIVASGKLEYAEADCFFKQLITGVNYMHEMGVSHRDLKPENLILTQDGTLKITDFGNGECFRMAWEKDIQYSEGICGSSPYIAPEVFSQKQFDPRGVDIWACGLIYMAMRTGTQLWRLADPKKDEFFEGYLMSRKDISGYDPIESLKRARCRNVIYSILDPKPERRINGKQILNSEWGREIVVCNAGLGLNRKQNLDCRSPSPAS